MRPPREFLDKFAAEHPTQATLMVAFGFTMLGFVLGLFYADGCK